MLDSEASPSASWQESSLSVESDLHTSSAPRWRPADDTLLFAPLSNGLPADSFMLVAELGYTRPRMRLLADKLASRDQG